MTDPQMTLETVAIKSLVPDPANARKHSSKNLEAIANSLTRFGQRRPLVVTGDSIVIAGNGTLEAAKSLGWTEIAVTRTPRGWDYETARAYALADNRTAELAEWDSQVLVDQLLELDAVGWDVSELGFESLTPPTEGDPGDAFAALPDGDRADATQMTFTLTLAQGEQVKEALEQAKPRVSDDTGNLNSNGNALALIVQEWLSGVR
jgi:ParB-like chromosome segregation protein Spo0J